MDREETNRQAGLTAKTLIGIAAISAIVAFGAVYGTLNQTDNTSDTQTAGQTGETPAKATPRPSKGKHAGALKTFVFKKPPADLADVRFTDGDGKEMTLADFQGKAILLNLWATWCAPCREEMPALDRLARDMRSEAFDVVALAVDRGGATAARRFLEKENVTNLALYIDKTARATAGLKAVGLPTTILIDKNGKELGRLNGPAEWDSDEAKALIRKALAN